MGSIDRRRLKLVEHDRELPFAEKASRGEIGSRTVEPEWTTATIIERDPKTRELVFGDEVDIDVWVRRRSLVKPEESERRHLGWNRLEVRLPEKSKDALPASLVPPAGGDAPAPPLFITVAEHPLSLAWADWAELKPSSHRKLDDRGEEDWRRLDFDRMTDDQVLSALEHFRHDVFEKRSGFHVAAFGDVPRPFLDTLPKNYGRIVECFSIGTDPGEHETELRQCDRARKLLEFVEDGRLEFWFRNATAKMDTLPALYENVADSREEIMLLAIRVALAGPTTQKVKVKELGDDDVYPTHGSWKGRPVMDLVDHLFRNAMNLENRREDARVVGELIGRRKLLDGDLDTLSTRFAKQSGEVVASDKRGLFRQRIDDMRRRLDAEIERRRPGRAGR